MKILVKVMDGVILQFIWICHLIYNIFGSAENSNRELEYAVQENTSEKQHQNDKRHLIRLYTTTSNTGKPTCYMDVYQLCSSADEARVRNDSSKGIPNKTYMRYIRDHSDCLPGAWMEYSTMTI